MLSLDLHQLQACYVPFWPHAQLKAVADTVKMSPGCLVPRPGVMTTDEQQAECFALILSLTSKDLLVPDAADHRRDPCCTIHITLFRPASYQQQCGRVMKLRMIDATHATSSQSGASSWNTFDRFHRGVHNLAKIKVCVTVSLLSDEALAVVCLHG
ncbi:uncharacterized protein BJ212DRAFT_1584792 [Suillus subaureus]|uniref:Uncharacterized protein n=1 Tax=Suillus subaureus TaxID=48587 RepID=A0A9P7ELY9_9AGAM|nr:uncharacterized protein BJ212DRAFT_1584792 [Suillus subaureus]KAG1824725.1 hypothetical protein BJ212DRAFT_1584792 [Suillus subaureus]